ncbi:MAG: hypothetical protein NVS9B4_25770 [Candidatus Acidiferrum sp.]
MLNSETYREGLGRSYGTRKPFVATATKVDKVELFVAGFQGRDKDPDSRTKWQKL